MIYSWKLLEVSGMAQMAHCDFPIKRNNRLEINTRDYPEILFFLQSRHYMFVVCFMSLRPTDFRSLKSYVVAAAAALQQMYE